MSKGLRNLVWGAKHLMGVPPRDEKETFARLSWNVRRQPRYTDGHFQFPFGDLRYVDALVLKYQYREIFIGRGYDFACSHDSPLILDCGGNIGLSVVWFKQRYPKSRVMVFEADPSIAEVLKSNMAVLKRRLFRRRSGTRLAQSLSPPTAPTPARSMSDPATGR